MKHNSKKEMPHEYKLIMGVSAFLIFTLASLFYHTGNLSFFGAALVVFGSGFATLKCIPIIKRYKKNSVPRIKVTPSDYTKAQVSQTPKQKTQLFIGKSEKNSPDKIKFKVEKASPRYRNNEKHTPPGQKKKTRILFLDKKEEKYKQWFHSQLNNRMNRVPTLIDDRTKNLYCPKNIEIDLITEGYWDTFKDIIAYPRLAGDSGETGVKVLHGNEKNQFVALRIIGDPNSPYICQKGWELKHKHAINATARLWIARAENGLYIIYDSSGSGEHKSKDSKAKQESTKNHNNANTGNDIPVVDITLHNKNELYTPFPGVYVNSKEEASEDEQQEQGTDPAEHNYFSRK